MLRIKEICPMCKVIRYIAYAKTLAYNFRLNTFKLKLIFNCKDVSTSSCDLLMFFEQ